MDDESRFRWSIAGGVTIGLCLLLTWLYATWLIKAVVLTIATTVWILGRFYLLPTYWGRIKQRGNQKQIRNFVIAIVGVAVLILVLAFQDLRFGPVRLR